jgi:short subunit dehydrogenase-like uncharacterized protein
MKTKKKLLIYGANGFTGQLIVEEAVRQGLAPIIAGRNAAAIASVAQQHGIEGRVFGLDARTLITRALADVAVVLHAAGPFVHTMPPMFDACMETRTHYIDITGEIGVFEQLARRTASARERGIMLLPGAGFDVVPTDCLAAHLSRRTPNAQHLILAFRPIGRVSRGTALTAVEHMQRGGMVRREGTLVPMPVGHAARTIDFGRGPVPVVSVPWGDVSTAYYSTGCENIEVFMALPKNAQRLLALSQPFGWAINSAPVKALLNRLIRSGPPGPSAEERASGLCLVWGEMYDERGRHSVARLQTPEAYTFTALSAVLLARKALSGDAPSGFQTPSLAYGADVVLEIPGVTREDVG